MKRIILILILLGFSIYADNVGDIRNELKKVNKNITSNKEKVEKVSKEQKGLLTKLNQIEKELESIKKEYYKISEEYVKLNRNVGYIQNNLKFANSEMKEKNDKLKEKILKCYKYDSEKKMEYLFSGDSLFDILDREEIIKIIIKYEREDINKINEMKNKINNENIEIINQKKELVLVRKKLKLEKNKINNKISEKNKIIKKLKNKKLYYNQEIKKLKSEKSKIEKRIEEIIKARTQIKGKTNLANLQKRMGSMIYPVDGKLVLGFNENKKIGNYGETLKSNGIEIKGKLGSRVKAALDGKVIYVGKMEELNNVIILDHGYGVVTVYGNLISSYVKKDQKVSKGGKIGVLGITKNTQEALLYFELRLNTQPINPFNLIR